MTLARFERLDSEVVTILVDVLQSVFVDHNVRVPTSALERIDAVGLLVAALMTVWGCKRFADSRWLRVGPNARHCGCRSHLIARFLRLCEAHISISGYYLDGF